jgi:hypothetical protein
MSCFNGTNIFSSGAGKVVAVEGEAVPIFFAVDGALDTFNDLKAIVTSVGFQAQSGYQFMHALRDFVYVYVFTERVGEVIVSGLAFPEVCGHLGPQDGQNDPNCVEGNTGMERVITWYECNRITTRAEPISISFGGAVSVDAFLVGLKVEILDAATGIAQFSMRFNYIPRISDSSDFCFQASNECDALPCQGPQDTVFETWDEEDD